MDQGFYDAFVTFSDEIQKKRATINYNIETGPLYRIASKEVTYPNASIRELIQNEDRESYIRPGGVLTLESYNREKNRIAGIMQNNGFPYFTTLNISKRPQAIKLDGQIDIKYEIFNDADSIGLRKYRFGNIVVDHNYNPFAFEELTDTATLNTIQHLNFDTDKSLKQEVMNTAIPFREGDLFSADALEEARQNILRYNIYSSVIIQRIPDPEDPNVLNIYFILQPSKKYEFNVNFDINNTQYSSRSSLLGISAGPEVSNRNTFGGGETFTTGLQFQTEFNPFIRRDSTGSSTFQTFIFGFRNNLIIPRFVDYLKTYKLFSGISPDFYSTLQQNGISSMDLNYDYVYIRNLYKYHSFLWQTGNNFNWAAGRNNLRINNLSVTVLLPDLFPDFVEDAAGREFVLKSLDPQIFTSLLFSNAQFTHVGKKDFAQRQFSFYGSVEVSGVEMMLANAIANNFRDTFQLFDKFEFSKFFKIDLDGRFTKDLILSTAFASRINIGVATPLPGSTTVPFVKQFFLGGPSSMRAWRIRELGPGNFQDSLVMANSNQPFANVGDLKIEMNAEYRFPLFWRLNSALFLDVGNIWLLGKCESAVGRLTVDFRSGPSSMRAWRIRELGPGKFQDSLVMANSNQPFANVGDLKIEMNAEYRFPLFWRLNSALFLDVGNIWLLGKSENGVGRLTPDFWREFAVGTGTGLRVDLTFFILRLDWGIKLKLPYQRENGSYWAYSNFGDYLKKSNLNLAISMPF